MTDTSGQVVTFYSYKGGTGRSMALANVACLLAAIPPAHNGVLMVDWDLDAPGLHRYFFDRIDLPISKGSVSSTRRQELLDDYPGLIDILIELNSNSKTDQSPAGAENGPEAALSNINLDNYILNVRLPDSHQSPLHLLKAGRFNQHYSHRVTTF